MLVRDGTIWELIHGCPSCISESPIQSGFIALVVKTETLPVCMKFSARSKHEQNSSVVGSVLYCTDEVFTALAHLTLAHSTVQTHSISDVRGNVVQLYKAGYAWLKK